jgi:beta-galactosidase
MGKIYIGQHSKNDNSLNKLDESYWASGIKINNAFTVTAEIPFSFSVLPYSVKQLREAKHHFELPKSDGVYVHLDVAMSGVGTASCGPALIKEYQAPKKGNNTFRIILNK